MFCWVQHGSEVQTGEMNNLYLVLKITKLLFLPLKGWYVKCIFMSVLKIIQQKKMSWFNIWDPIPWTEILILVNTLRHSIFHTKIISILYCFLIFDCSTIFINFIFYPLFNIYFNYKSIWIINFLKWYFKNTYCK